jgi:cobalt/nickel transport system permease protein
MHIPDGFLSLEIWGFLYVLTSFILVYSITKVNKRIGEKHIPMMGVLAAFIFAGQMLNFPVAGGTSGHMLGSTLSAIVLGPFSGTIIMSVVFIIQTLIFQDGGLTALGANIFNMGIIGTIVGYYIYHLFIKIIKKEVAIFLASWCSVVLAALMTGLEIALSGIISLEIVVPAMSVIHIVIGIAEGLITLSIIRYISKTRPDLLKLDKV